MFFNRLCSQFSLTSPAIYTFVNPYSYGVLRESKFSFDKSTGVFVDGIGLVWVLRLLGLRVSRKSFDMTSLAPQVFTEAASRGLDVCLVGSGDNEICSASGKISAQFEGLKLSIVRNGYFSKGDRETFLQQLVIESPAVVVVGMGSPLQERFLADLWELGWRGVGFTCGGFFHQTASSKNIDYYPYWIDRLNLRWLYRMYDEPKLIRRYLIDYPKNITLLLYDFYKYKR
ncbi:glycosyltransferase [Motiliproteus coralliicola]|uniref:Glycosyltransferase n=1 Tax=Motiliproteus coralliicola TaxID=2283196 RepID=A0A369WM80_9GAMM|nr:WecB/TagA/CpsF family glycosyltransferase [Motiliproteus coralliicola]RDE22581.1 glycosyltransferase [Motiliproteus coralliicola]